MIFSQNIRLVCKDVEEFSIGICQLKLSLISARDKYKSYNSGETKYNTNSTQSLLHRQARSAGGPRSLQEFLRLR